jgi:hypothetical protein
VRIEQSGTPYFCFKDLDENKPTASIKLRVETIDYFLKSYREKMTSKIQSIHESKEHAINMAIHATTTPSATTTPTPNSITSW